MMDYRKAYGLPERYFLSLGRMVEKKNLATLVEAYARFARASVEKHGAGSGEHGVRETTDTRHTPVALVFVGSGELEGVLRERARSLGLRVVDRTDWRVEKTGHSRATRDGARRSREQIDPEPWKDFSHRLTRIDADKSERLAADRTGQEASCRVTPAVGKGPQSQAENCKPNAENSVESDRGAVYFYGFRQIEENPVFYALAEAFVLPSLKEEWGLVVNEAMACSLPVIVSRTAGCAEDLLPGSEQVTGDVWRVTSGEQAADARADRSMERGAGPPVRRPYGSERSMESGEEAGSLNPQLSTLNSLEERSNGFVFDPKSSDALCEALRRIADQKTKRPKDQETDGLTEMGRRSREIVGKFSCENFARQALRAAEAASA